MTATIDGTAIEIPASADRTLTEAETAAHKAFVNDVHWVLFPLQAAWADGLTATRRPGGPVPGLTAVTADHGLHVQYPAAGAGYTPGDAYTMHLDAAGMPVAWSFFKGGAEPARLVTTWADWQTVGPLQVPTSFATPDGKPFITITDMEVTTR